MTAMASRGLTYDLLHAAPRNAAVPLPSLWQRLLVWHRRRRERSQLAAMDDRALSDLGLSRIDARQEWRKPFWRA